MPLNGHFLPQLDAGHKHDTNIGGNGMLRTRTERRPNATDADRMLQMPETKVDEDIAQANGKYQINVHTFCGGCPIPLCLEISIPFALGYFNICPLSMSLFRLDLNNHINALKEMRWPNQHSRPTQISASTTLLIEISAFRIYFVSFHLCMSSMAMVAATAAVIFCVVVDASSTKAIQHHNY